MYPAGAALTGHPTPPAAEPVAVFVGQVAARAQKSSRHVEGEVHANLMTYADANSFAWFAPAGGWELRNHRKLRRRGLSGGGDVDGSQRR